VTGLAEVYAKQEDAQALRGLLSELRPLFAVIPKAKTAKLVRGLIEAISRVPNSTQLQVGFSSKHPTVYPLLGDGTCQDCGLIEAISHVPNSTQLQVNTPVRSSISCKIRMSKPRGIDTRVIHTTQPYQRLQPEHRAVTSDDVLSRSRMAHVTCERYLHVTALANPDRSQCRKHLRCIGDGSTLHRGCAIACVPGAGGRVVAQMSTMAGRYKASLAILGCRSELYSSALRSWTRAGSRWSGRWWGGSP